MPGPLVHVIPLAPAHPAPSTIPTAANSSSACITAHVDFPSSSNLNFGIYLSIASASDEDALKAYQLVSKLENISPSLEPSHAFAEAIRIAPKLKSSEVIIVNSCGDSLKDKDIIKHRLGSYTR